MTASVNVDQPKTSDEQDSLVRWLLAYPSALSFAVVCAISSGLENGIAFGELATLAGCDPVTSIAVGGIVFTAACSLTFITTLCWYGAVLVDTFTAKKAIHPLDSNALSLANVETPELNTVGTSQDHSQNLSSAQVALDTEEDTIDSDQTKGFTYNLKWLAFHLLLAVPYTLLKVFFIMMTNIFIATAAKTTFTNIRTGGNSEFVALTRPEAALVLLYTAVGTIQLYANTEIAVPLKNIAKKIGLTEKDSALFFEHIQRFFYRPLKKFFPNTWYWQAVIVGVLDNTIVQTTIPLLSMIPPWSVYFVLALPLWLSVPLITAFLSVLAANTAINLVYTLCFDGATSAEVLRKLFKPVGQAAKTASDRLGLSSMYQAAAEQAEDVTAVLLSLLPISVKRFLKVAIISQPFIDGVTVVLPYTIALGLLKVFFASKPAILAGLNVFGWPFIGLAYVVATLGFMFTAAKETQDLCEDSIREEKCEKQREKFYNKLPVATAAKLNTQSKHCINLSQGKQLTIKDRAALLGAIGYFPAPPSSGLRKSPTANTQNCTTSSIKPAKTSRSV